MVSQQLLWAIEGSLNTAFEAVEELDALLRDARGGDPSPIGEVESPPARVALRCIREAGNQLRSVSVSVSLLGRVYDLLDRASASVEELGNIVEVARGVRSDSARRAVDSIRRARRLVRLLAES